MSRPPLPPAAERVCANAARLGVEAGPALAWALDLAAPVPGRTWLPLCCWCAERADPAGDAPCYRPPRGGACGRCPIAGRDVLVCAVKLDVCSP